MGILGEEILVPELCLMLIETARFSVSLRGRPQIRLNGQREF